MPFTGGVISAAMEVVNRGDVHGDSTESVNAHFGGIQVCHIVLILRARNPGDTPAIASLAAWGHEASLDVVVAPGPVVLVMTACEEEHTEPSPPLTNCEG